MDAVFERGEQKIGFYSETNRGEEFRTGIEVIPPGQSYRIFVWKSWRERPRRSSPAAGRTMPWRPG